MLGSLDSPTTFAKKLTTDSENTYSQTMDRAYFHVTPWHVVMIFHAFGLFAKNMFFTFSLKKNQSDMYHAMPYQ